MASWTKTNQVLTTKSIFRPSSVNGWSGFEQFEVQQRNGYRPVFLARSGEAKHSVVRSHRGFGKATVLSSEGLCSIADDRRLQPLLASFIDSHRQRPGSRGHRQHRRVARRDCPDVPRTTLIPASSKDAHAAQMIPLPTSCGSTDLSQPS